MKTINGPFGSKLDIGGNLVFPKIDKDKLEHRKKIAESVIIEVEKSIEKSNFTKSRIAELKRLERDLEDLKLLGKVEKNKEHLKFLKKQDEAIKKYLN